MGVNISPKRLLQGVIAYSKTSAGKQQMADALKKKGSNNGGSGSGSGGDCPVEISEIVSELLYLIDLQLGTYVPFVNSGDIIVSAPVAMPNGTWKVELSFNPEAVHRDSLLGGSDGNTPTGDGIDNIVALYNTGYDASDYTYGWWEGHAVGFDSYMGLGASWIRSRKYRTPLLFMEQAIESFNALYLKKNVRATLGDTFRQRKT